MVNIHEMHTQVKVNHARKNWTNVVVQPTLNTIVEKKLVSSFLFQAQFVGIFSYLRIRCKREQDLIYEHQKDTTLWPLLSSNVLIISFVRGAPNAKRVN